MSMLKIKPKKYNDGRTKQAFKDQCDINKILKKAMVTGSLAHAQKYPEAVYGEFADTDLLTAYEQIGRANEIFGDLPSEVRSEFNNNALEFVTFASKPENIGRLQEILPAIAEPGSYFPNPVQRGGMGAGAATPPVEPAAPAPETPAEPAGPPQSG